MKKEYSILVNHLGKILESNYPIGKEEDQIHEIMPIFSYLEPFKDLSNFLIEGYEFEYNGCSYYTDILSNYDDSKFEIKVFDKTDYYKQKAIKQSAINQERINEEYVRLHQKLLTEKNNYRQFILYRIEEMINNSLAQIESYTHDLNKLKTYQNADKDLLQRTSDEILNQIERLRKATLGASLLTKFDVELLFQNPKSYNLKNLITTYEPEVGNSIKFNNNCDPNHMVYIGQRGTDILFSYLFDHKVQDCAATINVTSRKLSNTATEINIEYIINKPNFELPKKVSYNLWLPSDIESSENLPLIKQIVDKLKQIYLAETKSNIEIAA